MYPKGTPATVENEFDCLTPNPEVTTRPDNQFTTRQDTRQKKTRQDKTRKDRTGQDRTRQDKTGQDKTRQEKTRQNKTREDKTRQGKTRKNKESIGKDKKRQGKTRQDKNKAMEVDAQKIRQDKARQGKTTQDTRQSTKTRHDRTQGRQDKTPPRTTRQTVTFKNILPVLFFSSYILIQILVLSGHYNIGTKDRVCSDTLPAGVEREDDFDDCWGFRELLPADSQCSPIPFCRSVFYPARSLHVIWLSLLAFQWRVYRSQNEALLSDADCDDACLPDTGNCPTAACTCNPGRVPPVDFVLLSPTQAYYRWGGARVLAYLKRACPRNDLQFCIRTCPPSDSDDHDLCLESCKELCTRTITDITSSAKDQSSNDSSAGLTAAAIVVAAAVVSVAVAATAYRVRRLPESMSGLVKLLDPVPVGTQPEISLEAIDGSSFQSFEIASV